MTSQVNCWRLSSLAIVPLLIVSALGQGVGRDKASNITELGCTASSSVECNAPWVYCIDAECETDVVNKVAKCRCWKQASGPSVAPSGNGGAPCVLEALGQVAPNGAPYPNGGQICDALGNGTLISTFGKDFKNTSYIEPFAYTFCEPRTPFAYCFGAPCVQDPQNADYAICDCPYVFSDSPVKQTLTVPKNQCSKGKELCYGVFNDDPIASLGETAFELAKVADDCKDVISQSAQAPSSNSPSPSSTPSSNAAIVGLAHMAWSIGLCALLTGVVV